MYNTLLLEGLVPVFIAEMVSSNSGDPKRRFLPTSPFREMVEEGINLLDLNQEAAAAAQGAVDQLQQARLPTNAVLHFNFKLLEFRPHAPPPQVVCLGPAPHGGDQDLR